jgi:hypothetical protein
MTDIKIIIKSQFDKHIGFLSNDSLCYFKLAGKDWKSITHYMSAKKCDFFNFPTNVKQEIIESIQKSASSYIAKNLSLETSATSFFEDNSTIPMIYTKFANYTIPYFEDNKKKWVNEYPNILEIALRAKFDNPYLKKKLCETRTCTIEYPSSPLTAQLIMKIRRDIISPTSSVQIISPNEPEIRDLVTDSLSDNESELILSIIRYSLSLRDDEGQITLYPEMVEDVIYNFYQNVNIFSYLKINNKYVSRKNFDSILHSIKEEFIDADESQKYNDECSIKIAIFIQWLRFEASEEELKNIYNKLSSSMSLILPPRQHCYRKATKKPIITNVNDSNESEQLDEQFMSHVKIVVHHLISLASIIGHYNIERDDVKFLYDELYNENLTSSMKDVSGYLSKCLDSYPSYNLSVACIKLLVCYLGASFKSKSYINIDLDIDIEDKKDKKDNKIQPDADIINIIYNIFSRITEKYKIAWSSEKLKTFCHIFVPIDMINNIDEYIFILENKFESYKQNLNKGLTKYKLLDIYEKLDKVSNDTERFVLTFGIDYIKSHVNNKILHMFPKSINIDNEGSFKNNDISDTQITINNEVTSNEVIPDEVPKNDEQISNMLKDFAHEINTDHIHNKLILLDTEKKNKFVEMFNKLSTSRKKKYLEKLSH